MQHGTATVKMKCQGLTQVRTGDYLLLLYCYNIPVLMQRAASRSVRWVIWSGDSSMWTQPTFPSNSNWWKDTDRIQKSEWQWNCTVVNMWLYTHKPLVQAACRFVWSWQLSQWNQSRFQWVLAEKENWAEMSGVFHLHLLPPPHLLPLHLLLHWT